MKRLLTLVLLSGCAPAYHPSALHPTLFDDKAEVSVAGHASVSGLQLSAAYAPVDHVAVRGRFHWRPESETDVGGDARYWVAALGAEGFDASEGSFRVAVGLEAGFGRVDSRTVVTTGFSETVYTTNGALLQFALPFTVGWEFGRHEIIGTGLTGRLVSHTIYNDLSWAGQTQGSLFIGEGAAFFRVGRGLKFDAQVGLSIPLIVDGDVPGLYFPVMMGVGLMGDIDLKKRDRDPSDTQPAPEPPDAQPASEPVAPESSEEPVPPSDAPDQEALSPEDLAPEDLDTEPVPPE